MLVAQATFKRILLNTRFSNGAIFMFEMEKISFNRFSLPRHFLELDFQTKKLLGTRKYYFACIDSSHKSFQLYFMKIYHRLFLLNLILLYFNNYFAIVVNIKPLHCKANSVLICRNLQLQYLSSSLNTIDRMVLVSVQYCWIVLTNYLFFRYGPDANCSNADSHYYFI